MLQCIRYCLYLLKIPLKSVLNKLHFKLITFHYFSIVLVALHSCQGSVCVSCVPASCVHIWFVSCPRLMWLLVNSCPAVCMWLSMINLCIYSPVCSLWFRLVYSLLPVFPVCQPCLVLIKDCYLSLRPRLRVPVSSLLCAPWQFWYCILFIHSIISLNNTCWPNERISLGSTDYSESSLELFCVHRL